LRDRWSFIAAFDSWLCITPVLIPIIFLPTAFSYIQSGSACCSLSGLVVLQDPNLKQVAWSEIIERSVVIRFQTIGEKVLEASVII
jgi:hypothetical protein